MITNVNENDDVGLRGYLYVRYTVNEERPVHFMTKSFFISSVELQQSSPLRRGLTWECILFSFLKNTDSHKTIELAIIYIQPRCNVINNYVWIPEQELILSHLGDKIILYQWQFGFTQVIDFISLLLTKFVHVKQSV